MSCARQTGALATLLRLATPWNPITFGIAPVARGLELGAAYGGELVATTNSVGPPSPRPDTILQNAGGANAVIPAPLLSDASMNEIRHLDPPTRRAAA